MPGSIESDEQLIKIPHQAESLLSAVCDVSKKKKEVGESA
jgi:hypothetical protein